MTFSFTSCKFAVQRCKASTGRVVTWRSGITHSFTLEASFCGSNLGPSRHGNEIVFISRTRGLLCVVVGEREEGRCVCVCVSLCSCQFRETDLQQVGRELCQALLSYTLFRTSPSYVTLTTLTTTASTYNCVHVLYMYVKMHKLLYMYM